MKNFSLTILLITLGLNFVKAEIPQSEKEALLAIASSLHLTYNWNTENPVEEWGGITISNINGEDHVSGLSLSVQRNGSNYTINFSDQIANLSFLEELYINFTLGHNNEVILNFDFNHISGLNNLRELSITSTSNFNSGDLNQYYFNTEKIALLSNLEELTLGLNKSEFSIPTNLNLNPNLKKIDFRNIKSQSFPNVYTIISLEELSVTTAVWDESFPEEINQLPNLVNLKKISFTGNFTTLPISFYQLPTLEDLSLKTSYGIAFYDDEILNYQNQLKKIKLETENIGWNDFFWQLTSLEEINLSFKSYLAIPLQIANFHNLKKLIIWSDTHDYHISPYIKFLENLEELMLLNQQNVIVAPEIYEIPNLKTFVHTVFDEIPEEIGNFESLEKYQVQILSNQVNALPEEIGNLTQLKSLDILNSSNNNTNIYEIPNSYFNLTALEQIWLGINSNLNVTNKFIGLPALKRLSFGGNGYHGFLNMCQNFNLQQIGVFNTSIDKVDIRHNNNYHQDNLPFSFTFSGNPINTFYVDDVNDFNNYISLGKINITDNLNYEVITTNESCLRNMNVTDINKSTFKIYPNPTKDFLYFEKNAKITDIVIISMDGKTYKKEISDTHINVANLPSGIYHITYKKDNIYIMDKFIKK